jgi:hypothetical protein
VREIRAVTAPVLVIYIGWKFSNQVHRLEAAELRLTNALRIPEKLWARFAVLDRTE